MHHLDSCQTYSVALRRGLLKTSVSEIVTISREGFGAMHAITDVHLQPDKFHGNRPRSQFGIESLAWFLHQLPQTLHILVQ